jgi:pimeloyl-ACP methyl ester carboxylesterase
MAAKKKKGKKNNTGGFFAKAKRTVKICAASALALLLFALIFPLVHKTETLQPRDAAPFGEFVALDNGLTLRVQDTGKGEPTLLLIHGFAAWGYTWNGNAPELSKYRRVIVPDLPGFGFSDKPADAEYSYPLFASSMLQLMDKKGVRRATLIGNSMGGGVAIRFAADYPDRVDKIVLVDSAGVKSDHFWGFKLISTPGVNSLMSSLNNPAMVKFILKRMIFHDKSVATSEKAQMYMLPFRTVGQMDAAAVAINNIEAFTDDDFARVKAPVLIVWGEKDRLIDSSIASVFARKLPGSKLVIIPKCGHCPQEEQPETFNNIVKEFLNLK